MADYITKIRTADGDLPIDFDSLWNKPTPVAPSQSVATGKFADAKAVYDQIKDVKDTIKEIQGGDAFAGITINGKKLSDNPVLTASDVGAAPTTHNHSASDITSGALSMERGGTNANNGSDGLKNLLAAGPMILANGKQYGTQAQFDALKDEGTATKGQIFFVKVQQA